MNQTAQHVRKESGELIAFDIEKLRYSLSKSGASPIEVQEVIERMQPLIHDGMTTKAIYKQAFNLLKRVNGTFAARYSLKRALRDLGPAGYYFELWISKFLQSYGYITDENQLIKGKAVTHEADVVALKDNVLHWIECKFRNTIDAKISVTTPMYLLSRVNDIKGIEFELCGGKHAFQQGWLITNAYLTADSIAFGEFYGIKMLSWDYPAKKSIKHLVDRMALYPITCLTTINQKEKQFLMENNVLLVKDLHANLELLGREIFNPRSKSKIVKEVQELIVVKEIIED